MYVVGPDGKELEVHHDGAHYSDAPISTPQGREHAKNGQMVGRILVSDLLTDGRSGSVKSFAEHHDLGHDQKSREKMKPYQHEFTNLGEILDNLLSIDLHIPKVEDAIEVAARRMACLYFAGKQGFAKASAWQSLKTSGISANIVNIAVGV
ncbi:unnamed protein product, partial [marine sediment metagenome]